MHNATNIPNKHHQRIHFRLFDQVQTIFTIHWFMLQYLSTLADNTTPLKLTCLTQSYNHRTKQENRIRATASRVTRLSPSMWYYRTLVLIANNYVTLSSFKTTKFICHFLFGDLTCDAYVGVVHFLTRNDIVGCLLISQNSKFRRVYIIWTLFSWMV